MSWSLISEIGLEYAPSGGPSGDVQLSYPAVAERGKDGRYLIVDEIGLEKSVNSRVECRTLLVDADHSIIYDTASQGIDDGYGCFADDGLIALLRRSKWELTVVEEKGSLVDKIDVSYFSKRSPRIATWTRNKTYLIAFVDDIFKVDLVELDSRGRMLWYLPVDRSVLGLPGSLQLLPNNRILIADAFYHVAMELDRDGSVTWEFGERGNPAAAHCLANPKAATQLPDGRRLIADTRNHRILSLGVDCNPDQILPSRGDWCCPSSVRMLPGGNYLVCDGGNARVIELAPNGDAVWQYGRPFVTTRRFSFPRSVEVNAQGAILVADTGNNRVVEVATGKIFERESPAQSGLFWPRCARRLKSGSVLIADGRNSRIVEVTPQGEIARQLYHLELAGGTALKDPHDVRLLDNGHLLVADSSLDLVVETDWSGLVYWVIGGDGKVELDDPHSAQLLADDTVLISDPGHDRILRVDREGRIVQQLDHVYFDSGCHRFSLPKYAEVSRDGIMTIVDTGNNRVFALAASGDPIWVLTTVPDSPISFLHQPRWAHLINQNEVLIADHLHNRVLHLEYRENHSEPNRR